ncbi:DNA replication licensing factor MCM3 [Trichuris trichiura]|uniref:DNA replication licensing factor MCM3 n=1 Tax=Trichuris trichiura TaxID=36087 RepID=A0A077ZJ62_TRITR|nr:DNA replication licensing factor MCM3 [Trichuris trichiura]
MTTEQEQELLNIERQYVAFLDDPTENGQYMQRIFDMVESGGQRLIVNINDLRRKNPERATNLLVNATQEIPCAERALKELLTANHPSFSEMYEKFSVGFEGSFGQRHLNPRTLKSNYIGNLVCCEGIVTKSSLIYPKIVKSVHYCPETKRTTEKRYTDITAFDALPTGAFYPKEDENQNPLETEYGLCKYKDHQKLSMQELPETAPTGQLPRSVEVILDSDLTDRCSPGDRIRAVGVYRCLPNKQSGYTSGLFRTVLIANNVQLMSKQSTVEVSTEDLQSIRGFVRMKDQTISILTRSLAPSICGHDEVKKAILCLLIGGTEKKLPNGTRLRGDINVLLVGDPSVAKSQILRYVLNIAPRAVATTGRGSTGVGLTAAVTTDHESGERQLEAGAMVLGDRGVVCIDEFDKMSDIDRTAVHEVMEQGRTTITKAGIQATLNARCSVLAAANPISGRYDDEKSPMENLGMQDSLLSRFDLIFVLMDEHDSERDGQIASHVINLHCYRAPGEPAGCTLSLSQPFHAYTTENIETDQSEETEEYSIYEKNTSWLPHGEGEKILTTDFLRKFISYAKKVNPVLTAQACEYISEKYADLRAFEETQSDKERTMPMTARMLETLIRLSTAFAKIRFAKRVTVADAEKAYSMLSYAIFKKVSVFRRQSLELISKPTDRTDTGKRKRRSTQPSQDDSVESPMKKKKKK